MPILLSSISVLQLGHALSRVESSRGCRRRCTHLAASIGPRALARGKNDFGVKRADPMVGFNWATRSRAWKEVASKVKATTTRSFNWATRSRAWKGGFP